MARNYAEVPQVARQLTWKYWSSVEEVLEKDFYVALQAAVANAIREQLAKATTRRLWVGREVQLEIGAYKLRARLSMMDPILSNTFDVSTAFTAQYREKVRDEHQDISTFIAEVIRYPDARQGAIYQSLIGLDSIKADLEQKLKIALRPQILQEWAQKYYALAGSAEFLHTLRERYPLIVLEGEVGAGKTALARSVGHTIAAELGTTLALFVVNAQVRGGGHVGELTQNISRAFDEAERCQEQEQIPVILLIDEADALAQVRGTQQTHHEDDAGVNTLIQRIDRLRGRPIVVIFSTNLFQSLDSAILRRAAVTFHFERPDFEQRRKLFRYLLGPIQQMLATTPAGEGALESTLDELAWLTNPKRFRGLDVIHRYTHSDISQRIFPSAIEKALGQERPLGLQDLREACRGTMPTRETQVISLKHLPAYARYFEPGHAFSNELGKDE